MNTQTRQHLENIHSTDRKLQNEAYFYLMDASAEPVDWTYEAWNGLVSDLTDKDNHVRAIAAQLLANLSGSDPEKRLLKDFERLLEVTRDERFVTARHALQAIWKVGLAGEAQRNRLLDGLELRYMECVSEKNGTLTRFDIIQALKNLYDKVGNEKIREKAVTWIEMEADLKYRKKYAAIWK